MFCDEKLSKTSYICAFNSSKKRRNWFPKNLHNSGIIDHRKLPDLSLNHIFNALSIGVQYTLSFQLTNFGLKCLISGCGFKSCWSYFCFIFFNSCNFSPKPYFGQGFPINFSFDLKETCLFSGICWRYIEDIWFFNGSVVGLQSF